MPQKTFTQDPAPLRITLLGRFHIEHHAQAIQLSTRKTESLLAYLILHPWPHGREKLAALFWGDSSDAEARNSLRNALASLNKKLGHPLLIIDRHTVSLNREYPLIVDALEFEVQAGEYLSNAASRLQQINIELYQNDLLTDFYDDWIFPLREYYRSLFIQTLLGIIQQLRSSSEYEKAIEYALRVITFDPANEQAHQHIMFCHAAKGDRSAAIKQYEKYVKILKEDLGVEPDSETTALYEWVKHTPPAANLPEARITNLPIPLTSFIGRRDELNHIREILKSAPLLTLTGPGGSGKTRLAIEAGRELTPSFKDGVWWVDLTALKDKDNILFSITKALGIREVSNQTMLETLAHSLRPKHLLLILDNCEHLIKQCAQIAHYLLEQCDHLKILVTSRETLNIDGEKTRLIPGLSLPPQPITPFTGRLLEFEAIHLFNERAQNADSGFALTEQNAPAVTLICTHLDGNPLAIELAAAWTNLLTPAQIANRLNERFQFLTNRNRTAPARHHTLQAVMDWSYELLSEKEKLLFRYLAVFSGSWNLEAAEEICPANGRLQKSEIIHLLSNLVDKSLVILHGAKKGEPRYHMLETIRQYAREGLSRSGELYQLQRRHLDYFLKLVEAVKAHLGFFLSDQEMLHWLEVLIPEHDNLRTVIHFCEVNPLQSGAGLKLAGNLHWYFLVQNSLQEGRDWIYKLQTFKNDISPDIQAQAFLTSGFLAAWQGDFASAFPACQESLRLFEEINHSAGIAFSLHGLGFAANGLGKYVEASHYFDTCLQIATEIDDKWLFSIALHFIAISNSFRGNFGVARSQFEECIRIMNDGHGTSQGIAFSEFHLGRLARITGEFESSFSHHAAALKLFMRIHDLRGIGYSLFGFACLAHEMENPARTAKLIGAIDLLREQLGSLLETILQEEYEHTRSAVQAMLGEERFMELCTEGRSLPLEQIIDFALSSE